MKRSHGKYSKQGRNLKSKGRRPITAQLKTLSEGDYVQIDVDPRFQKGMPHLRFNHRSGFIIAKRGNAYEVGFKDGGTTGKSKILLIRNVHLRKVNDGPDNKPKPPAKAAK